MKKWICGNVKEALGAILEVLSDIVWLVMFVAKVAFCFVGCLIDLYIFEKIRARRSCE